MVYELAKQLACALREHEFYVDYLSAKNSIENNYQLRNLLDEYRRLQFEVSFKKSSGQNIDSWKEAQLSNDFELIQAAPDAYKFLMCETKMLGLLSDVSNIINENVPIDLNF